MKGQSPNKVFYILTNCVICNKIITKKNYKDGIYLCDECNSLTEAEKFTKLNNTLEKMNSIPDEELDKMLDELIGNFDE